MGGRKRKQALGQKGKSSKRPSSSQGSLPEHLGDLPDRRTLDALVHELVSTVTNDTDDSPLGRAQQLMYDAFEADDPERQVQLAQRALAIAPDCADAYIMLGDYAESEREALDFYQQAVAAGERAIGEEEFKACEGQFWGYLETRPYMRARLELAHCLWQLGRREEAVEHYRDMLRLNPNDNQGVRYTLLHCLLDLDRNDAADALLRQYEDDYSAEWYYNRALLAFRRDNNTSRSRDLLANAAQMNQHVPHYLLGYRHIPQDLPPYIGRGDESEAAAYAADNLPLWKATAGAIPWLRETLKVDRSAAPGKKRTRTGWNRLKADLSELAQNQDEVWHVDVRRLLVSDERGQDGPWALLVTSPSRQQVVATSLLPSKPTNTEALRQLAKIILEPDHIEPRRPAVIQVRLKTHVNSWRKKLAEAGIDCQQVTTLEDIDRLAETIAARMAESVQQRDAPSASDEQLSELPQVSDEVWQADVRQMAAWIGGKGQPERPWLALVTNRTEDLVLAQNLTTGQHDDDWLKRVVSQAMSAPAAGEPHRPGTIVLSNDSLQQLLQPWLGDLNVQCELAEALDMIDSLVEDVTRHMAGDDGPMPLLDTPGVEPHHVGGFFEAAAEYYRQSPWRVAAPDVPIRVECDRFSSGPWYALVMGQSGMVEGLALYEDRRLLTRILLGQLSDEENGRRTAALSMNFNEAFEIPPLDLHHAERYGWLIAGPEAYPSIMRVNPGLAIRPPLAWELELMEACLRTIPEFLRRDDSSGGTFNATISTGPIELHLSWADLGV